MQNKLSSLHAQAPELTTHSKWTWITEKKQHQRNGLNHKAQQTNVVHPDHSETYFQLQEGKNNQYIYESVQGNDYMIFHSRNIPHL